MSTERSTFGLNSILPSTYRNKAEAFAKCLQDKLRSLSGLDDPTETINGRGLLDETPATPHGSLSKYSEEEIVDSVFLQGPLAYKRKSIPERTGPPPTNGRYIGSVTDRRGFSSDSEDSDDEEFSPAVENVVHKRIAQLQQRDPNRRLTSVDSIDSTTSWCSCEEPEEEEDEEIVDSFASQIKGSPTIHNPRLRNYKRKGGKGVKEDIQTSAPAESDLFFDFDAECFSPNLDEEEDGAELRFFKDDVIESDCKNVVDTGQVLGLTEVINTPPPSPAQENATESNEVSVRNATESLEVSVHNATESLEVSVHNATESDEGSAHNATEPDEVSDYNATESDKDFDHKILDENSQANSDINNSNGCDLGNTVADDENETKDDEEGMILKNDESLVESTLRWKKENRSDNFSPNLFPEEPSSNIEKHETEINEKEVPSEMENIIIEDNNRLEETTPHSVDQDVIDIDADHLIENVEKAVDCLRIEVQDITENHNELLSVEGSFQPTADEEAVCGSVEEVSKTEEVYSPETSCDISFNLYNNGTNTVASIVITKCDDDETENHVSPKMKLRRCSSLKTWKTPPGTPGRKKIVRFADALGLDLADVRTFLDELPKIPRSAFEDLHCDPVPVPAAPRPTERTLIPMFQQPGAQMDFLHRVRQNNVSLESAVLSDVSLFAISGMVRVQNLSFHKSVHIRYTKDSWVTFSDLQGTYIPGSSDGFCDNFSFTLYGHTLNIGDRLEFAIRYECGGGQFWDNNSGINYVFQCMPRIPMPLLFPPLGSSPDDAWTKFY